MIIGLGIGIPFIRNYISSIFDPSKLFTGNTNGVWYDPSDINLTWRRNLLTYSEQFDNAAWAKDNASVSPNVGVAPDSAITADKLVENSSTSVHRIATPLMFFVAGTSCAVSVYAKAGERRYLMLNFNSAFNARSTFDLQTGTVSATSSGSAAITSVGDGWYRCSINGIVTTSANTLGYFQINTSGTPATDNSYLGDGTSGIYIWGAQLELGSTATPYQRITDGVQDYLQYQAQPVLFQNAAGTTPVTAVEQPVGLMLDKSKGLVLGPELVTNGGFESASDWALGAGWSISGGVASANPATGIINQNAYYTRYQTGKTYIVTVTISSYTSGYLQCYLRGNLGSIATNVFNSARTWTCIATAGSSTTEGIVLGFGNFVGSIDNISVRELPGNHAFNGSGNSANFPVLSARYNLLTKTEDFSDAAWPIAGSASVSGNVVTAPDGTLTADRVTFTASAGDGVFQNITSSATQHIISVWAKTESGTKKFSFFFYNATNGVVRSSDFTATTTWQRFTFTTTTAVATSSWYIANASTADAGSIVVWGADLRVANDALGQPAYQRVNTSTDYDTVGFKPYLRFNGTNQWLQTNSIDFSYGDKMFVSAGVRKLSDATGGAGAQLCGTRNATQPGTFEVLSPSSTLGTYYLSSGGSLRSVAESSATYPAPITNVLSGIGDISGDKAILRVNGSQVASSTADQGTGNYGNYPLYIGARAGSSLWFNGRLYGMVVAGKQASAVEIDKTEDYIALKTGFAYPKISGAPTFTVV